MGKTIRKDRKDVKYKEGQYGDRHVYKCRCSYCTGKNKFVARAHEKEYKQQLQEIGV